MTRTTPRGIIRATTILLSALGACGGKVVVDGVNGTDTGSGGAGSTSSSNSNSSSSNAGAGVGGSQWGTSCLAPPNPATLTVCAGDGVTINDFVPACVTTYCDPQGFKFTAECKGTTCVCLWEGMESCTCILNQAGDFCDGKQHHCCPWGTAP